MTDQFDIFLSHNSKDKSAIREIKQRLLAYDLKVWLDEDELPPGHNWIPLLEEAICQCKSAGAFVSSNGIGQWEDEEIQALLREAVRKKQPVIPVLLPGDYKKPKLPVFLGNRTYLDMRGGITPKLIANLVWGITGKKPDNPHPNPSPESGEGLKKRIDSDRLPTVKGEFFGREAELELLNRAWQGENNTNIIQFIAPGGTGKTKLLRHWIDHTPDIEALIAWSFYSQGASEDKQTSATPFFTHAFDKLEAERTEFATEEDKGQYLAELVQARRCVLILDGLEPLQYAGAGMRGELKDRALRQLLKTLSGHNLGLCIITTRIAVHELTDRPEPAVISHNLENLTVNDGVRLLQSLGVTGRTDELQKTVVEYGQHALALSLLGNVLRIRYYGDVQKRVSLKALVKPKGSKESRHAFKVMQAYEEWFAGEPELALLQLLGLFDHPIERAVLQVLWDVQIPGLTADIDEDEWLEAISSLREEHHLLAQHGESDELDCHPLIREYFGAQLKAEQPEAWQQAHERLYEYYKALPEKEFPDTLEEMQPLFSAVAHGCAAGLHSQVINDVYYSRIRRGSKHFIGDHLGGFTDDLSALSSFYIRPWERVTPKLSEFEQALILIWSAVRLRAIGRLHEALHPMRSSFELFAKQREDNDEKLVVYVHICNLYTVRGDLALALHTLQESLGLVDRNKNKKLFANMLSNLAYINCQCGNVQKASSLFAEAEASVKETYFAEGTSFLTGSLYHYYLFQLEINNKVDWVVNQLQHVVIDLDQKEGSLRSVRLKLILIHAYIRRKEFCLAEKWLVHLMSDLYKTEVQYWSHGLLVRSVLYRETKEFELARKDLQGVWDIAEPSGMRLHLTDYHLEMARLLLAENAAVTDSTDSDRRALPFEKGETEGISHHIEAAAQLINDTGYHRRDAELAELQQQLKILRH